MKYCRLIFLLPIMLSSINTAKAQTEKELESRFVSPVPAGRSTWNSIVYSLGPRHDETFGIGYDYSGKFPVGVSCNYTYSCLSVRLGTGWNLDNVKYKDNLYYPCAFLTLDPGLYCRYFSLNLGCGALISSYAETKTMAGTYEDTYDGETGDASSSVIITTNASVSVSERKWNFMLRPSITGYIPICWEDYYITVNVGYNYFFGIKELNGWSVGIGFNWPIER